MRLEHMTWHEVEDRLTQGVSVMLPSGSTEQHGPIGLIGTDTICATEVAVEAARLCDAIVAPPLAYTPAPFNTGFPGTVSVTPKLYAELLFQVCDGLLAQGFQGVFVINGHGANLDPARAVAKRLPSGALCLRSWWDPDPVAALRRDMFGAWEGMHATPSEVAITQALFGVKTHMAANTPPEALSAAYIQAHAGDKHGPPDEHRARFPDGRVGSHSALATPKKGQVLLAAAAQALSREFRDFSAERQAAAG